MAYMPYVLHISHFSFVFFFLLLDPSSQGPLCGVPLPGPGISFHSWTQDEDIWNELANFALMISPTERSSLCADEEAEDHERKTSVTSTDSGIEGDLLASDFNGLTLDSSGVALPLEHRASMAFPRWTCVRRPKAADRIALVRESVRGSNQDHTFITEGQNLTAHVVVMGDDQTLGRLARTFHSIRKRETRHIFLTKRLKLELYYIPVISESAVTTAVEENTSTEMGKMTLARFLGNVDPWYDCTVNGLGSMVLKLAQMRRSCNDSSQSSSFLVDIISYYVRTGFQPVHIPIYSIKISFSRLSACPVEDLFVSHVQIEFKMHKTATLKYTRSICQKVLTQEIGGPVISVNYRKASLSKREKDVVMSLRTRGICISAVPPNGQKNFDSLSVRFSEIIPGTNRMDTIRTGSISIRALEKHNFTLCLDKDSRKTFKDVQRIEISQALDPGCCLHSSKSRHVLHDKEASLSKYMSKSLKLPINTFSGIIP
uniref:Phosphoinositide-3-kinase, regulatory subunit 6b n=1 Tax=Denticeps clupeoides TaxID=299321 RepID=A0AAY4CQN9_9TELE